MSSYGRLWLELDDSDNRARKNAAALPPRAATELADVVLAAPKDYPPALVRAAQRIKRDQRKLAESLVNWQTVLSFETARTNQVRWTKPPRPRRHWRKRK